MYYIMDLLVMKKYLLEIFVNHQIIKQIKFSQLSVISYNCMYYTMDL